MIPYGRQDISQDDIRAVVEVLRSDFLTQGPVVPTFEAEIADFCSARHAVAANSATSALHIAMLALGVGEQDIVWTSPISFVASANCALYCGAEVDFVDIDPLTYNMSCECLAEKLSVAKKAGKLPKVVIPVHMCGQSCDMAGIHALSQEYSFRIVEDASHAIGGKYRDRYIGNGKYSDITVFSFHPVKIITSAEGGMALTNDEELATRMRLYCGHGISREAADMAPRNPQELWFYQQVELGFNYRMTDVHAALGLSQLGRLVKFVTRRNEIAERYDRLLADLPLSIPGLNSDCYSAFHLYIARLKLGEIDKTQREVFDSMRAAEILVNLHYIPIYRQPFYEKMGFVAGYCPQAEKYYSEAISLPIYPGLQKSQQDQVIEALREVIC